MCHSYIHAARQYGFTLRIASPQGYDPEPDVVAEGCRVELMRDPKKAAADADLVVTDVWASMGQEEETRARQEAFAGFEVDDAVMARAKPAAVFMHCLPAHRGEEVSASVIDSPQSLVWDEAGNRLHAQKALLEFLLPDAPVR
jgi:ornithine carbamoyltransferase